MTLSTHAQKDDEETITIICQNMTITCTRSGLTRITLASILIINYINCCNCSRQTIYKDFSLVKLVSWATGNLVDWWLKASHQGRPLWNPNSYLNARKICTMMEVHRSVLLILSKGSSFAHHFHKYYYTVRSPGLLIPRQCTAPFKSLDFNPLLSQIFLHLPPILCYTYA